MARKQATPEQIRTACEALKLDEPVYISYIQDDGVVVIITRSGKHTYNPNADTSPRKAPGRTTTQPQKPKPKPRKKKPRKKPKPTEEQQQ